MQRRWSQILRSAQVLKQEAEEIGYEEKEVAEYVKQHQALDEEEKASWRDAQKLYEKKRTDEIWMAEIQAEADAQRIQAEKAKRADEIQLAKVESDKELAIKQMELNAQAQASRSAAVDPPPCNRDYCLLRDQL